jgi:hypothetical protein
MRNKGITWESTSNQYVNWLSSSDLRKEFSKNIKYDQLSLWWLTSLIEKDNLNDTTWYKNLFLTLKKKRVNLKKNTRIIYFIYKLLKKFFLHLATFVFVKIFLDKKKNIQAKKKNCIHSITSNLITFKNNYLDRQYGMFGLKRKKDQLYFIEVIVNLNLIKNFSEIKKKFKKIPYDYYFANHYISFNEILKIYFKTVSNLFILLKILKKKNFFLINGKDCKEILEPKLISSFLGPIQEQLIRGKSLQNFLQKNECKNFITCFDFHPGSRVLYYFANNSKVKNVINVNHANYSKNNFFFNFKLNDFSNKKKKDSFFSPKPDFYFCQGKKYYDKLKKVYKKKVFKIGSLKNEFDQSLKLFKTSKEYKNKHFKNQKKILLILCSLHDYQSFIKILNKCNLENFNVVVLPHPHKVDETISNFRKKFKNNFVNGKILTKSELIEHSDHIIFGDTSLGLELSVMNKSIFRVYDREFIPTFDIDDEIPTATSPITVSKFLEKKRMKQKSKLIEKLYFYKYDKKASQRFDSLLSKL